MDDLQAKAGSAGISASAMREMTLATSHDRSSTRSQGVRSTEWYAKIAVYRCYLLVCPINQAFADHP